MKHCEFCHRLPGNPRHVKVDNLKIYFRSCDSCWTIERKVSLISNYIRLAAEGYRNLYHPHYDELHF